MSALPPKADMDRHGRDVRFVPKADIRERRALAVTLSIPCVSDLYFQMDRADAIRLLKALVFAGMDTRAPRANAWIEKKALEIGLEGNRFVSGPDIRR